MYHPVFQYSGPEIPWIDGQRQLFSISFHLVSTVVTGDQHLDNLFAHTDRMLEHRGTSSPPPETEICKILKVQDAAALFVCVCVCVCVFACVHANYGNCLPEEKLTTKSTIFCIVTHCILERA
jgi:hypothetical protein